MAGYYHDYQHKGGGGKNRSGGSRGGRASGAGSGRGSGGSSGGSYRRSQYSHGGSSQYSHGGSSNRRQGGSSHSGGGYGGGGSYGRSASSYLQEAPRYGGNVMVNPWEDGMAPMVGNTNEGLLATPGVSGLVAGQVSSNLIGSINQLTQMNSNESKLALNILNSVLSGSSREGSRDSRDYAPPSKMRRMDRGGGNDDHRGRGQSTPMYHQPARKFPQRDQHYNSHRTTWDQNRRGRQNTGASRMPQMNDNRRKVKAKPKPKPNAKDSKPAVKVQKQVKGEAAASAETTTSGKEGDKAEGEGTPAAANPKKSDSTDSAKEAEEPKIKKEGEATEEVAADGNKPAEKKKDDIPKRALHCHICDLHEFSGVTCYSNHLESRNHKENMMLYIGKRAALLNVLRADAKLASQRQNIKAKRLGVKSYSQCIKCQCNVYGKLKKHTNTIEHQLVNNFLQLYCCGRWFPSRQHFEGHRLSLHHLKAQYEAQQKKKAIEKEWDDVEDEADDKPAGSGGNASTEMELGHELKVWNKMRSALEKLKATNNNCRNTYTIATVPPYNPETPTGLTFIAIRARYYCKACTETIVPMSVDAVEGHCRSMDHYNAVLACLKKVEENKRLKAELLKKEEEKKKKAEEDAKKKAEEEKKKAEEEGKQQNDEEGKKNEEEGKQQDDEESKGAETQKQSPTEESVKKDTEDMNNMETVDEAVDDPKAGDVQPSIKNARVTRKRTGWQRKKEQKLEEELSQNAEEDKKAEVSFENLDNMETVDEAVDDQEAMEVEEAGGEAEASKEPEAKKVPEVEAEKVPDTGKKAEPGDVPQMVDTSGPDVKPDVGTEGEEVEEMGELLSQLDEVGDILDDGAKDKSNKEKKQDPQQESKMLDKAASAQDEAAGNNGTAEVEQTDASEELKVKTEDNGSEAEQEVAQTEEKEEKEVTSTRGLRSTPRGVRGLRSPPRGPRASPRAVRGARKARGGLK